MESSSWTILLYTAVPDLFSHLPAELIDPIRRSLAGERFVAAPEVFRIERSLPYGHVQAGCLQPSLFDQDNLAEIRPPEYPGERLVACFNPVFAEERRRKRKPLPEVEIALQMGIVLHRFVQRAFRCLKGMDLRIRPVHHRTADHLRAHLLLCLLA